MKVMLRNIILFLSAFTMIFIIFICDVSASAASLNDDGYHNADGCPNLVGSLYSPYPDFSTSSPVLYASNGSQVVIPDNYILAGYASTSDRENRSIAYYLYVPADTEQLCVFFRNGLASDDIVYNSSTLSQNRDIFIVQNNFTVNNLGESDQFAVTSGYKNNGSFTNKFQFTSYLPLIDNNGNVIGVNQDHFKLTYILDKDLTYHYAVQSDIHETATVDFYIVPTSSVQYSWFDVSSHSYIFTPIDALDSAIYDTLNNLFPEFVANAYVHTTDPVYHVVNGLYDYYIGSNYSTTTNNSLAFNEYYYGSHTKYGSSSISGHFPAFFNLDVPTFYNNHDLDGTLNEFNNISMIAQVHKPDDTFVYFRHNFTVSEVMALMGKSNIHYGDAIGPQLPDSYLDKPEGIQNLNDLALYLKYLFDTQTTNIGIMNNNLALNIRNQVNSINWRSIVGSGISDTFPDFFSGLQNITVDTDFDLPSLMNELSPLLAANNLSLPDLTAGLAPFFNNFDISPTGYFSTHLDSLFDDIETSVTDLSTEINYNTTRIFVPDFEDMSDRFDVSERLISNKFQFVDDIKDNLEDVRDTIEDSSESPPEWSFRVYNVQLFLVDWSVYAPYRTYVQNILIAIAYILLFKHIYKTIPLNGGDD